MIKLKPKKVSRKTYLKEELKLEKEKIEVLVIDFNEIHLKFKETKIDLKLKSDFMKLQYNNLENKIEISYLKRDSKKVLALINYWVKKIEKYSLKTIWTYNIEYFYKHFPMVIKLENEGSTKQLILENFYGCKSAFYFNFTKLIEDIHHDTEKKVITMSSYDDIKTGNELENLIKLRLKTHIKKVDRRIFTDGFFITKTETK